MLSAVDCVWNVMAHAQKPDFVFRRNGRVHLNLRGRQLSRLLAREMCASALVMLDTPSCEVVWRVDLLATHPIRRQLPLYFPSRVSPSSWWDGIPHHSKDNIRSSHQRTRVFTCSSWYLCPILTKPKFSRKISTKALCMKIYAYRSTDSQVAPHRQRDRHT